MGEVIKGRFEDSNEPSFAPVQFDGSNEMLARLLHESHPEEDREFRSVLEDLDRAKLITLAARVELSSRLRFIALEQAGEAEDALMDNLKDKKEAIFGMLSEAEQNMAESCATNLF